ncbi:CopG family ribbon-helix-helix protein [Taurinivorans muris]|uniref:CopG family ribbon-helix-helix protein n=1 Tax=Taurinivorans muris TaxID=2787751 RepID=A0ABY5Y1H2_9BACT|nr:CopG family ribbon-helix-helix protein [Desulfovibrionaceae bacterium LT0009]
MQSQSIVNTSIKIPCELRERIQKLAAVRNQSSHAFMLSALENHVSREEKREAWRQEGIKAWEEFQQTGLHLTNQEVLEWIDTIVQGREEPMPKCHI